MNAQEARKIAEQHIETVASIHLIEKLIEGAASRGQFGVKVELSRNIASDAAKHLRSKGFEVRYTSTLGTFTLWVNW